MRMLHPSLGHQSPEDCEFGEWEGYGWGVGIELPLHQIVFCAGKRSQGQERPPRTSSLGGETSEVEASWLWALAVFQGSSGRPGQRPHGIGSGRGTRWLQELFSVVLDFAYPKRLFFPSFAKYFSKLENNLNV